MKFSDADNLAYLRAQSSIIEKEAVELDYNSQYSELIPVSTQGNPFAAAVVFASSTKVGRAGWINGNADDLPRADLDMKEVVKPVHTAAIGYGYGFEEPGIAQAMGINLAADKAIAARRSYEEFVDVIAFNGDSTKTIKGLTNLGSGSYKAKTDATANNWSDADKLMAMLTAKLLETGSGGVTNPERRRRRRGAPDRRERRPGLLEVDSQGVVHARHKRLRHGHLAGTGRTVGGDGATIDEDRRRQPVGRVVDAEPHQLPGPGRRVQVHRNAVDGDIAGERERPEVDEVPVVRHTGRGVCLGRRVVERRLQELGER